MFSLIAQQDLEKSGMSWVRARRVKNHDLNNI